MQIPLSQIWNAANGIMNAELMKLCAKFMGSHLDQVNFEENTWKFIQPQGMRHFLEAVAFNEQVSQILGFWLDLEERNLSSEDKLRSLLVLLNLDRLPSELILFLLNKAFELGISGKYE